MNIKSIRFSTQVIIGLVLGVFAGIFFGEYCKVLKPIGTVFIMLLEAFLYPFLVCSLIYGIGKLAPANFLTLFKRGWLFYIIAWVVTLITLAILIQAFPGVAPLVVDPVKDSDSASRFLKLLIPENLFLDFTNNFVPAVVVFSVLMGLAIQRFEKKGSALDLFEAISKSSIRIWMWIIKLSPIAVFALFADLSGTVSIAQLDSLILYMLLFIVASLVLTFWIVPGLISAFIDYPITKILKEMQGGILMTAVTMVSITSIPYVLKMTSKLAEEQKFEHEDRDGIKETVLSFSYPLVQLGNLFVYLFMGFCVFYFKQPLSLAEQLLLPVLSLLSSFGSAIATVNSISFLSSWLGFTENTTELYVELMTITRYFQVIASSAALYFITILVTFAYFKKLRLNKTRLAIHLILPFLLLCATTYGFFELEKWLSPKRSNPYLSFSLPENIKSGVKATVYKQSDAAKEAMGSKADPSSTQGIYNRILRTGVLRVGYNATPIPFSYFNDKGALVGYDVAFAYDLARTLNVELVFIPYTWAGLIEDLKTERFDIAISGIYVTKERIRTLQLSNPYFKSQVVMITPSDKAKNYESREAILSLKGLRIGVFNDNVLLQFVKQTFPDAEAVFITSIEEMLAFKDFDAVIWTLEQAKFLASMKPGLSAVLTENLHPPFLFAYMMPLESDELLKYINYWLELRIADGSINRMKEYWFEGKTRVDPPPRWSIIRNVLYWVD